MVVPPPNGKSCLTASKPGTWSVGAYVAPPREGCQGYGLVTVKTDPPRVLLQVKNQLGDVMLEKQVTPQ